MEIIFLNTRTHIFLEINYFKKCLHARMRTCACINICVDTCLIAYVHTYICTYVPSDSSEQVQTVIDLTCKKLLLRRVD
jgi:hypothetical protein